MIIPASRPIAVMNAVSRCRVHRVLHYLFVCVFCWFMLWPPEANAFLSGYDKYGLSALVPNDHGGLTLGAFLQESNTDSKWYPECAVKIVADANNEQDNPALPYQHKFHFDRNDSMSHAQAFSDGVGYIREQMGLVQQFGKSKPKEALEALGRALHALQDFYAHSNFIELGQSDKEAIESALLQGSGTGAPSTLKLTWFNPTSPLDTTHDPLAYPHHIYAKDFPFPDRLGSYFSALYSASSASRKLVESARTMFGSDASSFSCPAPSATPSAPSGLQAIVN